MVIGDPTIAGIEPFFTEEELYPIPSLKPYHLIRPIVRIYDEDLVRIGETTGYESLTLTENWYSPHEWQMTVNRNLPGIELLDTDCWIEAYWDPDSPSFLGKIEKNNTVTDKDGRATEKVSVEGRGAKGAILKKRLAIAKFSTGDGYDTLTSTPYETAMRHLIDANFINALGPGGSTDSKRVMTGISLDTFDRGRGGTADELKLRTDKILDLLESWSRTSSLSCDLEWQKSGKTFVFVVKEGTDRSGTGTEKRVLLSLNFGNVLGYNYEENIYDESNLCYVGGSGDGASRLLETVFTETTEPEGWDRTEQFLDSSDSTTSDVMITKGKEQLADSGPKLSLTFNYNWLNHSAQYNRDFFLGDTIIVDFPGVATMTSGITTVTRSYSDSLEMEITVGSVSPGISSIVKSLRTATNALRRH